MNDTVVHMEACVSELNSIKARLSAALEVAERCLKCEAASAELKARIGRGALSLSDAIDRFSIAEAMIANDRSPEDT